MPFNSAWSADHKLLTLYHTEVNESISVNKPIENCLKKFLLENQLADDEIAHLTSLETLKEVTSLSLTLKVFKKKLVFFELVIC